MAKGKKTVVGSYKKLVKSQTKRIKGSRLVKKKRFKQLQWREKRLYQIKDMIKFKPHK